MFALLMGLNTVSPDELHRLVQAKSATVIDVNGPLSWQKAHVPGALNVDPTTFSAADLPENKDATLVFYCSNVLCRKAPNAARRARSWGYNNSYVMSTGIKGWLAGGLPTESAG